jgi:hypothetical protein
VYQSGSGHAGDGSLDEDTHLESGLNGGPAPDQMATVDDVGVDFSSTADASTSFKVVSLGSEFRGFFGVVRDSTMLVRKEYHASTI